MTTKYLAPQPVPNEPPKTASWTDDTVLLVLTHARMEHLIPEVLENLNLFWPNRPQTWVVTDGKFDGPNVIRGEGRFAELLSSALDHVEHSMPWAKHVFLLLEDLCPLAPVDEETLEKLNSFMRANDGSYFGHYWKIAQHGPRGFAGEPVEVDGISVPVLRRSKDWRWVNSLACCVWRRGYLRTMIDAKLDLGIFDPWGFEAPVKGKQLNHYIVGDFWPTHRDGLYYQGKINARAVSDKDLPNSPLLNRVRRDYCGSEKYVVARLKRSISTTLSSIRKRVSHQYAKPNRGMGN